VVFDLLSAYGPQAGSDYCATWIELKIIPELARTFWAGFETLQRRGLPARPVWN
jgi:hypothetical protein